MSLAAGFCASADEAPANKAREVVADFLAQRAGIEAKAEKEIAALQTAATKKLLALHDELDKSGQRAEAETILAQLVLINTRPADILENTGNMTAHTKTVGKQMVVRVTGSDVGSVWGTDAYTADSVLASAAVHAGVVRLGEQALVLVTMVPGRKSYQGTPANGITSSDYGVYATSYQVLRIGPIPAKPKVPNDK